MAFSSLRKFVRLPSHERRLLWRTLLTLLAARLTLKLFPFARVRRMLTPRPGSRVDSSVTIPLVRWAIDVAQRVIPDATCLPQAVTAEALLTRGGIPVLLRIGVMKGPTGTIKAHAWAESGRIIVVGNLHEQMREYSRMPPLPPAWADAAAEAPEA